MTTTLLFVAGASLTGVNVLSALAGRRAGLRLVATNSVAEEPALGDFDEAFLIPPLRPDSAAFERRFLEVLASVQPRLVIPCRDDDVLYLARLQESDPAWCGRFLCGSVETARATLDKAVSWEFSSRHGLPFAPTVRLDAAPDAVRAFAREHDFPLIIKPAEGFASRGVNLLVDSEQVSRALGRPGYVLQKYLDDPDAVIGYARSLANEGIPLFHTFETVKRSVQAFIAPDGEIAGVFATCNTMRYGKSERIRIDDDPEASALGRRCAQVFAAQGWRGPLNIQCQRAPSGELLIYEFNGRFTGATAGRFLLGYDEVGLALRTFVGWDDGSSRTPPSRAREVVKLPQSRVVDPGVTAALERTGHWRAPG
jgi:carbamoyl-phosphate synthase large subunit